VARKGLTPSLARALPGALRNGGGARAQRCPASRVSDAAEGVIGHSGERPVGSVPANYRPIRGAGRFGRANRRAARGCTVPSLGSVAVKVIAN